MGHAIITTLAENRAVVMCREVMGVSRRAAEHAASLVEATRASLKALSAPKPVPVPIRREDPPSAE